MIQELPPVVPPVHHESGSTINTKVLISIVVLAAFNIIATVILPIFAPAQAPTMLLSMYTSSGSVIALLYAVLQVGAKVDGKMETLLATTAASSLDKAEIAGLKATLKAIQDQQEALLAAAAASNTQMRTETVTTLDSPSKTQGIAAATVTVSTPDDTGHLESPVP